MISLDHQSLVVIVKQKKEEVRTSLGSMSRPFASMIVKIDASNIGYGGILKQKLESQPNEQLGKFHLGLCLALL